MCEVSLQCAASCKKLSGAPLGGAVHTARLTHGKGPIRDIPMLRDVHVGFEVEHGSSESKTAVKDPLA